MLDEDTHVVEVVHVIGACCGSLSFAGGAILWLVANTERRAESALHTNRLCCRRRSPVLHILSCLSAFDCLNGASFMMAAGYLLPPSLRLPPAWW